MAQNDAGFVGSMPQFYDHHMRELLFQPYADDIAARLAGMTQGRLLETAAGTGIVTANFCGGAPSIDRYHCNRPQSAYAGLRHGQTGNGARAFPTG